MLTLSWKVNSTSKNKDIQLFDYEKVDQDLLKSVTHVLVSIPPDGDDAMERYGHCLENIKWLGYLSATNVYGDYCGNWVNEESETKPIEIRGEKRLESEKKWVSSKLPVHIFRLAGIYGPGRNALIDLQLGKARNVKKLFSLVHVEDISNILFSSMQNIKPYEIYNCADDLPATQSEVVTYAAELLNISPPEPVEISSVPNYARGFYFGSKKVSNTKIKKELSVFLVLMQYHQAYYYIEVNMFSTQSLPVENILLHQATYNGNINEVKLLLNVKTDINIKDKKRFSVLHFAV